MERRADGLYHPVPVVVEGATRERLRRELGEDFDERVPVYGVSWDDAVAYCAWRTRETGQAWRLPTEEEREKAARGVDGRKCPWGDVPDASLAKCRDSRDELPQVEPVGTFPSAVSVYGLGDASGNVSDWTASWFDARRTMRTTRGGGWHDSALSLRCMYRRFMLPGDRDTPTSIRCAKSL
jgi:formylglycine-generating enzyme required for sulfatase activity